MSKAKSRKNSSTKGGTKNVLADAQLDVQSVARVIAQRIAESDPSAEPDIQAIAETIAQAINNSPESPDWMKLEPNAKRTIKDSVFTHLFKDKQYTLQLFQVLHPEIKWVTERDIEFTTLDYVLVQGYYNDLGFKVGNQLLVLVEAQSSWTVNVLIRAMIYYLQTMKKYIEQNDLYLFGGGAVSIPKPEFYVVYSGDTHLKSDVIRLSEEFFGGIKTDLDVTIHVLTGGKHLPSEGQLTGEGHIEADQVEDNSDNYNSGDILDQYVAFTKIIDEQTKIHGYTAEAVREAIRICKSRNILKVYLTEHELEVEDIMVTLFSEEYATRSYGKHEREEGKKEGLAEGIVKGRAEGEQIGIAKGRAEGAEQKAIEIAEKSFVKGDTVEDVADLTGLSVSIAETIKERLVLEGRLAH